MSLRVAYYFAAFVAISTYNMILSVRGQCTVQGCDSGHSSINIVAEIQQLVVEAILQQQNEQVQYIYELLNTSFQQMKNQQDTVMTSLQAVDRRSLEQVQGIYKFLNASFQHMKSQDNTTMARLQAIDRNSQEQVQGIENLNASLQEMKNQQETVMTSLQAIDRRSQEQDIYIQQVQSIHELLNASIHQMKDQHTAALRRLEVAIQLLLYHDNSIKNQTQNQWKLAIGGVPIQPEIYVDLADGLVLLPSVNNWIIVMHRFDGSLNFYRNWIEYKNGFGDKGRGEFWLGNEIVHHLTNRRTNSGSVYTLRIEVQLNTSGRWFYADYDTFSLDSESNKFALRVSGYSGNAGDSLTNTSLNSGYYHGGMNFSTWDNNDRCDCAKGTQAGWWFNCCYHSCLTCIYSGSGSYFQWSYSTGWQTSGKLRAARMMIKSK